jgi:chromosome segregation ATPase
MAGITDRLFRIGKAKAGRAARDLPDLGALMSSLPAVDRRALEQAKRAGARARQHLERDDSLPPALAVELGGALEALLEQVVQLADRLARARAWLRRHDPEQLARQAALAELDEQVGGARAGAAGSPEALRDQARLAGELEAGIAKLSYRLQTAAREIESLEGRLASPGAFGAAQQLTQGLEQQRERAERALEDWAATDAEIGSL